MYLSPRPKHNRLLFGYWNKEDILFHFAAEKKNEKFSKWKIRNNWRLDDSVVEVIGSLLRRVPPVGCVLVASVGRPHTISSYFQLSANWTEWWSDEQEENQSNKVS